MGAAASKMQAVHLVCPQTLLFTESHKQKSNTLDKEERQTVCTRFKQLYLSNLSELDSCSQELFSQWPILSPPKILTFYPDSPCINYQGNLNSPLLYIDKEKSIELNHNRPPQKYEFKLIWCWHRSLSSCTLLSYSVLIKSEHTTIYCNNLQNHTWS